MYKLVGAHFASTVLKTELQVGFFVSIVSSTPADLALDANTPRNATSSQIEQDSGRTDAAHGAALRVRLPHGLV